MVFMATLFTLDINIAFLELSLYFTSTNPDPKGLDLS